MEINVGHFVNSLVAVLCKIVDRRSSILAGDINNDLVKWLKMWLHTCPPCCHTDTCFTIHCVLVTQSSTTCIDPMCVKKIIRKRLLVQCVVCSIVILATICHILSPFNLITVQISTPPTRIFGARNSDMSMVRMTAITYSQSLCSLYFSNQFHWFQYHVKYLNISFESQNA